MTKLIIERVHEYLLSNPEGVGTKQVDEALGIKDKSRRLAELKHQGRAVNINGLWFPAGAVMPDSELATYMGRIHEVQEYFKAHPRARREDIAARFGWPAGVLRTVVRAAQLAPDVVDLYRAHKLPLAGIEALADLGSNWTFDRQLVIASKMARGMVPLGGGKRVLRERVAKLAAIEGCFGYRAMAGFFNDPEVSYEMAVNLDAEQKLNEATRREEAKQHRARQIVMPQAIPGKIMQQVDNIKRVLSELNEKGILYPISQQPGGMERFCGELGEIQEIVAALRRQCDPNSPPEYTPMHDYMVIDAEL